jgi:hypothetical protein
VNREAYIRSLELAANQYKLSLQTTAAAHKGASWIGPLFPQCLAGMSYGGVHLDRQDLQLSPDDAATASSALEHSAMLMLAIAVDTAFEKNITNRFNAPDPEVAVAARIARILRNTFSHNPFFPKWECTNPNHVGVFNIPNVISLNTLAVNGQEVDWRHYGGPLAILRFLEHCKSLLARDISVS